MFELRWLERKTGNKLMNEHGYYFDETHRILQFRYKYNQPMYSYHSSLIPPEDRYEFVWSDWYDVPTINESEIKNA